MAYFGVFFGMKHQLGQQKNPNPAVFFFRKIVDVLAIPYSPEKVIDNMLVQSGLKT